MDISHQYYSIASTYNKNSSQCKKLPRVRTILYGTLNAEQPAAEFQKDAENAEWRGPSSENLPLIHRLPSMMITMCHQ